MDDKVYEKIDKLHKEVQAELNKLVFPHGREEAYQELEDKIYVMGGGRSAGKVSTLKYFLGLYPQGKVLCRDLNSLDRLVACGIQPSQIIVVSEMEATGLRSNTWHRVEVDNANNIKQQTNNSG